MTLAGADVAEIAILLSRAGATDLCSRFLASQAADAGDELVRLRVENEQLRAEVRRARKASYERERRASKKAAELAVAAEQQPGLFAPNVVATSKSGSPRGDALPPYRDPDPSNKQTKGRILSRGGVAFDANHPDESAIAAWRDENDRRRDAGLPLISEEVFRQRLWPRFVRHKPTHVDETDALKHLQSWLEGEDCRPMTALGAEQRDERDDEDDEAPSTPPSVRSAPPAAREPSTAPIDPDLVAALPPEAVAAVTAMGNCLRQRASDAKPIARTHEAQAPPVRAPGVA